MAVAVVPAFDAAGAPLSGLSVTWLTYVLVADGSAAAQPAITEFGATGLYHWTANELAAGMLDLGATANPRYSVWVPATIYQVIAAFDAIPLSGAPLAGLAPAWVSYYNVDTGISALGTAPAISALSGGLYKFTIQTSAHFVGVIDLGATASPRYIEWDSADEVALEAGAGTLPSAGTSTLPKTETRITVPSGGWTLTLTDNNGAGVTITIPAGDYYWSSVAPGGVRSLKDQIKVSLQNGGALTYTVSLDDQLDTSTGKLTIAVSAGTFAITWGSAALRILCGFNGNIGAIATQTSPNQVTTLWLPNTCRMANTGEPVYGEASASAQEFGREESDYVLTMAPSGVGTRVVYNINYVDELAFESVLGRKAYVSAEVVVNESVQKWMRDLMAAGGPPFRYYTARSDSTTYWTLVADASARDFLTQAKSPGRVGARSLHSCKFAVRKYVAA